MTDSGGDRIEQLRRELAELRAEVERLKAERGEVDPRRARHKRPKLRVIEGGLGAAAVAWLHEHWRSTAMSAAASTLAAVGALSWTQLGPEQIDLPETEPQPKPSVVRRTTAPPPTRPPAPPQDRQPPTRMPTGTFPPAPSSKRPTPVEEPTRTPTPASGPLLPSLPSTVPAVPTPTLTLRSRLLPRVTLPIVPEASPTCPTLHVAVTVSICLKLTPH